jgi:hypothetical protein
MKIYMDSKITIKDADHLNLLLRGQTYYWMRSRDYSVNDAGEVFINGKKIASIKKTKAGSFMNVTNPDFTIYDANGKPCILFQGSEQDRFLLLDDNKSYIPEQCQPQIKGKYGLAEFIGNESILTPEGFNNSYRAEFIKKYKGYDAMPSTTSSAVSSNRDRTAPVRVDRTNIYQGSEIIGNIAYKGNFSAAFSTEVRDMNNKLVSRIFFSEKDKYNMVTITIFLGDNNSPERKYENLWSTILLDDAIRWLVQNNHL